MKTIIRLNIFLILISITFSCALKKPVIVPGTLILPLGDTVRLKEGSLVYGLPMTVFKVIVEMERTIEKPGPYARYAFDLLGLKDIITQETESWSLEGITLKTYEEIDPSEFYVIESNTLFQTNVLALKKQGLILDLNPDLFNFSAKGIMADKGYEMNQLRFYDLGADEYYQTQRDTAYKVVSFDTTFIKIPYLVEKKKQLPIDQLAEKAAKALLELRDGKHLMLTGETNVFPQNEAAIDEMNRLDREYTELFTGKTFKERKTFAYTLIPQKEMVTTPAVLFRFSELTGLSDASQKSGIPVTAEFIPAMKTKNLKMVLKPQQEGTVVQKYDKLFYRVPDVVNIKINMGSENLYNTRSLIYQFGDVIRLPANYIIGK